jgi:P-type E1-E2 ATPase
VEKLAEMGIEAIMLTGDIKREISKLQEQGRRVAMAGDGVSDAPALACADIGIAICVGADIAVGSADIVLTKNDPADIPAAIALCRAVQRNIKQNLFWAFVYNAICVPAAVCGLLLGPVLPALAAAAMCLSVVSVALNTLRLRPTEASSSGQ